MTRHPSLAPVGHPVKILPVPSNNALPFSESRALGQHLGTAVTSAGEVFRWGLAQSQAWLTPTHLISLFSESV